MMGLGGRGLSAATGSDHEAGQGCLAGSGSGWSGRRAHASLKGRTSRDLLSYLQLRTAESLSA